MRVSEVMTTNPVCCLPADTAQTAAIIMRDEDTGVVPVVESKGSRKLVGLVTDRDLCIGVIADRPQANASLLPVDQFMTSTVVTCQPNEDLDTALTLMRGNQVRRIVVIDDDYNVLGIVSMADVLNRGQIKRGAVRGVMQSISEPTGEPSKPRAEAAKASR